mmetsp:Transcript_67897/g.196540  ORF Transcript_67897/g.196540 Transcript_67897/m.196540 type:complete len:205 (+) Transcript_67897:1068-1682(+)
MPSHVLEVAHVLPSCLERGLRIRVHALAHEVLALRHDLLHVVPDLHGHRHGAHDSAPGVRGLRLLPRCVRGRRGHHLQAAAIVVEEGERRVVGRRSRRRRRRLRLLRLRLRPVLGRALRRRRAAAASILDLRDHVLDGASAVGDMTLAGGQVVAQHHAAGGAILGRAGDARKIRVEDALEDHADLVREPPDVAANVLRPGNDAV